MSNIHMAIGKNTKTTGTTKGKNKLDNLIGTTDPKVDHDAREMLVTARIGLLIRHAFFGNLATRLQLVNADEWCATAATDGVKFYYNSRFVTMLKQKEVEFLVGHEVLHVVYDHMGRREERDHQLFNIANDYAVNADLRRHKIGEFIKTVPCLYESKYDGLSSEQIYDDLMKNVQKIDIDDLVDQMIDDHMDGDEGDGNEGNDGKNSGNKGKRPTMSPEERERVRQEIKQAILNAAQNCDPGSIPARVERMIKDITEPVMPWRELLQTNLTSAVRNDYSWMRPSRRSWHMDAIMPGMIPGEEIEVAVAIDMSGSISTKQAQSFLGEVNGMMAAFDSYKIHVFSFDTETYNPQDFNSDSGNTIDEYVPVGGGGTDFNAIFRYLKDNDMVPKRLVVFTDGYPFGSWGDDSYCDTTWIIHGNPNPNPPFGTYAIFDKQE